MIHAIRFILIPADLADHAPGSERILSFAYWYTGIEVGVMFQGGGGDFLCQVARECPRYLTRQLYIVGVKLYHFGGLIEIMIMGMTQTQSLHVLEVLYFHHSFWNEK